MTHYTTPSYLDPAKQAGYVNFCSRRDRIHFCIFCLLATIGVAASLYALYLTYY